MTKQELKMLERLYAAEIDSALSHNPLIGIVQSKSKVMLKLERDGLVRKREMTIPADRSCPFPVTISGWELTLAGNAAYCLTC